MRPSVSAVGYLLSQARAQATLDLSTAAGGWGQTMERPQALEAGEAMQDPADW